MCSAFIPVIHSIPSGEALIENVLCNYQIEKPLSCRLYKRGLNDTYLVETDRDRYILRVYRRGWRTLEAINFEVELLAFLHNHKMPVAYPLQSNSGSFTQAIEAPEGRRYATLFSYAPGRAVNEKLNSEQSRRLGEVLANIHVATDDFKSRFNRPALNYEYLLERSLNIIAPFFSDRADDLDDLQKQTEKIKMQLEVLKLPLSAPVYGICMGDVHSGNAHFTETDEPTLFDFDQCGYGWRTFDIGKFMHVTYAWKMNSEIRKPFLDGYQTIRKLSEDELASIPIFTKVAHIWVMGINCEAVGDVLPYGWFTDDWLDSKLALLGQLSSDELDIYT